MSTKKDKFSIKDRYYMKVAINLAKSRVGLTGLNPSVGCVVVKNNEIVSFGATDLNGRPHAETIALSHNKSKNIGSTVYLTLEPCSHYGKTPPCTNILIKSKVKLDKNLIFIGSSMGSWIALNLIKSFKKKIIGFIGIASAPDFLEELMWKKFNKKIKKIIKTKKIYYLKHGDFVYPITEQLIIDGKKNKIINKKINNAFNVTLIHGLKDEIVPLNFSSKVLKIFKNGRKKLIKIKNGDHSLSRKSDLKKITKELKLMLLNSNNFG